MFVLTVDQRRSRRGHDRVPEALERLAELPEPLRAYERTAGDEFQGVLTDPAAVVAVVCALVRQGGWSIGIGTGAVETPLPESTRAGRGDAFVRAREAVERAKLLPQGLAVRGPDPDSAADAEALLTLLALVLQRRSPQAWEAADLLGSGLAAVEAAGKLGITRQAIGQRLAAGHWRQELQARPAAARLLARASQSGAKGTAP